MLDGGTIQLGGKLYTRDITATLTQGSAKTDISSTGYRLDVEMLGGISRDLNVDFKISPVGQTETEFSAQGETDTLKYEGVGDLSTEVRFRLGRGESYPLLIAGAQLQTGDDDEPIAEIQINGIVQSPGKSGGRGEGRNEYWAGYGYLFGAGPQQAFLGAGYRTRGSKEGTDYGDTISLVGQGSFTLSASLSLVGTFDFEVTGDDEYDSGHNETDPSLQLEFGAMFSLSRQTEIIATARTLSGGDVNYYDNFGNHYATMELDSAIELGLKLQSRF
jgi:hypothetical protein